MNTAVIDNQQTEIGQYLTTLTLHALIEETKALPNELARRYHYEEMARRGNATEWSNQDIYQIVAFLKKYHSMSSRDKEYLHGIEWALTHSINIPHYLNLLGIEDIVDARLCRTNVYGPRREDVTLWFYFYGRFEQLPQRIQFRVFLKAKKACASDTFLSSLIHKFNVEKKATKNFIYHIGLYKHFPIRLSLLTIFALEGKRR